MIACHVPHALSRLFSCALLLASLMLIPACQEPKTTDKDLSFVDTTTAQELAAGKSKLLGLKHDAAGAYLDPRSEEQYKKGHIPGAINIPLARLRSDHELVKDHPLVIVYGDTYNDPVAIAASKMLIELKHEDVRTLRGGLQEWTTAGNKLETSP